MYLLGLCIEPEADQVLRRLKELTVFVLKHKYEVEVYDLEGIIEPYDIIEAQMAVVDAVLF